MERNKMIKKGLILFLGMSTLFVPNLYAESPFEDSDIQIEKETSNIGLDTISTAISNIKDNVKEDKTDNIKVDTTAFPVEGKLEYDGIRLREWAWGPITGTYNKTNLTVLGISGDFYQVEIDGVKGFMHKNFISIPNCEATGVQPEYPGDTWEGGYLSKEESLKYTEKTNKTDSETKVESDKNDSSKKEVKETVKSVNKGISPEDFKKELKSMKTPTREEIIELASSIGVSKDYVIILIGTTQREGYFKDPYLHYGWASAMLNQKTTIKKMQGWDPKHKGDSNYYSQKNINKGYKEAKSDVLKSVYLALKYRNKKIIECNGMYKKTPKSYNLIYKSSKYNCRVYEKK